MTIVHVSVMHVVSLKNSFYGILCTLKVHSQLDCFLKLNFLWLGRNRMQCKL